MLQSGKGQHPVKQVYFDYSKSNLCDASGIALNSGVYPTISYQEDTVWWVQVFETLTGSPVAKNMADAVSWEAALDKVYNSTNAPMIFTVNANIDSTGSATGLLKVDMDADTSTYLAAVSGITTDSPLASYFQLRGYNGGGDILYSIPFKVNALGCVYPSGVTPPPPTSNYYTKSQVDGLLGGLMEADVAAITGNVPVFTTQGQVTDSGLPPNVLVSPNGTHWQPSISNTGIVTWNSI